MFGKIPESTPSQHSKPPIGHFYSIVTRYMVKQDYNYPAAARAPRPAELTVRQRTPSSSTRRINQHGKELAAGSANSQRPEPATGKYTRHGALAQVSARY